MTKKIVAFRNFAKI